LAPKRQAHARCVVITPEKSAPSSAALHSQASARVPFGRQIRPPFSSAPGPLEATHRSPRCYRPPVVPALGGTRRSALSCLKFLGKKPCKDPPLRAPAISSTRIALPERSDFSLFPP